MSEHYERTHKKAKTNRMNLNCCDHNRFSINSNVKICIYQINNKTNPLIKSHLFFRSCIGIIILFFGIELIL